MNRLGIIRNRKSIRNRNGLDGWSDIEALDNVIGSEAPESHDELCAVLDAYRSRSADIIAINGGDGTVHQVVMALRNSLPEWKPALAIIPAGKIDLIANDVGAAPRGARGAFALAQAARNGKLAERRVTRPLLTVQVSGAAHPPVHGFFFGAGVFTDANALANAEAHAMGLFHGSAILWTITSMLLRGRFGSAGAMVSSAPINAFGIDGDIHEGQRYLVLLTTLQRLVLGLRPFWGHGRDPIRYTEIVSPPKRLFSAVLPLLRGRPRDWMSAEGYASGGSHKIRMHLGGPFILDGESFNPGPNGEIEITAPHKFDFVRP